MVYDDCPETPLSNVMTKGDILQERISEKFEKLCNGDPDNIISFMLGLTVLGYITKEEIAESLTEEFEEKIRDYLEWEIENPDAETSD